MRRFAPAVAAFLLAASALAQQGPAEGKWWKRPRIAEQLQLTREQTAELETIFARSKPRLIDLRAALEKRQFEFDQAMASEKVDRKMVEEKIEAREQARAALQKELSLMELDMKQILRPEQRERLVRMRENAKALMQQRRRRLREGLAEDGADKPPPRRQGRSGSPPPADR